MYNEAGNRALPGQTRDERYRAAERGRQFGGVCRRVESCHHLKPGRSTDTPRMSDQAYHQDSRKSDSDQEYVSDLLVFDIKVKTGKARAVSFRRTSKFYRHLKFFVSRALSQLFGCREPYANLSDTSFAVSGPVLLTWPVSY